MTKNLPQTFQPSVPLEQRAYTRRQIYCAGLLGGPLAAAYFIRKNFELLNNQDAAKRSLLYGILCCIAVSLIGPFIPAKVPGVIFAVFYAQAGQGYYDCMQKDLLQEKPRHSNWRVTAFTALWILPFLIILLITLFLYVALGVVKL